MNLNGSSYLKFGFFFKLPVNQMVIGQECGESIQALVGAYSYHINYPKIYFSGHASLCLST